MEFIIILSIFIIIDVAAIVWGADSRDRVDSKEWKRRYNTLYRLPAES